MLNNYLTYATSERELVFLCFGSHTNLFFRVVFMLTHYENNIFILLATGITHWNRSPALDFHYHSETIIWTRYSKQHHSNRLISWARRLFGRALFGHGHYFQSAMALFPKY